MILAHSSTGQPANADVHECGQRPADGRRPAAGRHHDADGGDQLQQAASARRHRRQLTNLRTRLPSSAIQSINSSIAGGGIRQPKPCSKHSQFVMHRRNKTMKLSTKTNKKKYMNHFTPLTHADADTTNTNTRIHTEQPNYQRTTNGFVDSNTDQHASIRVTASSFLIVLCFY